MESIVILADFTPESAAALAYGYALASEKGLPVVLVYVYDVPLLYAPDAFSGTFLPLEDAQSIATESLQKLSAEYTARYPHVSTTTRLALMGAETVLDENRQTANSLIIVGINPENIHDWWEDNRGLDMLRDSHHNVLAVQPGYNYRPVKRILLALQANQSPEHFPLASLQAMLSFTGASLHVVTVNAESALPLSLQQSLDVLGATSEVISGSEDVDATLARLVTETPTDWLAVVPGEYGFWAGLFHKSHTVALAEHSSVPLLALHLKQA